VSVLDFSMEELVGFLRERLEGRGVVDAYLFGSVAAGTANAWSDLDVVVVQPTDAPFIERPRSFFGLQDLGVPVDVLVYTPEEFQRLRAGGEGFWRAFEAHHRKVL
jgi:predicted nucleotidyltransferase